MRAILLFLLLVISGWGCLAQSPKVELDLDKVILDLPCKDPLPAKYRTCPDGMTINVSTKITGKVKKNSQYKYSVTGGKIVGSGANVVWDMTGARNGTYRITVSVGKGSSVTSKERTITVKQCPDCSGDCFDCPHDVLRASKDTTRPGDIIEIVLIQQLGPKYEWKVVGGTIVKGQGTDHITILVDPRTELSALSVTLNVLDERCFELGGCPPPQIEVPFVKKN